MKVLLTIGLLILAVNALVVLLVIVVLINDRIRQHSQRPHNPEEDLGDESS